MNWPDIPDHPDIRRMEAYGTLHPEIDEDEETVCPVCGLECETAYIGADGEPVGCENCIQRKDPWDVDQYQPKLMARKAVGTE